MYLPQVFMVVSCCCVAAVAGAAEPKSAAPDSDFAASFTLRGGYDSNPELSSGSGAGGSTFIGTETALAAGTRADDYTLGVAVEARTIHYGNPRILPTLSGKVILRGSLGNDDLKLTSTTTIADTDSYNLRSTDVIQSLRGEARFDALKFFLTAEGGRSSLNQTNAIFLDFLPSPQQYWRMTLVPGISLTKGPVEIGLSANLSLRRYVDEFDDFGFRRDNERVQPFVFVKYTGASITAFASVSRLHGTWHDIDFSDVDRTLFDGKFTWRAAPLTIDLTASRRAAETTFPISPITIDTIYSAKASWKIDPKLTVAASLGYVASEYLDSPFRSEIWTCGVGVSRELGDDYTLGVDLTRAHGTLISGQPADALIASLSLTRGFTPDAGGTGVKKIRQRFIR